MTTRSRGSRSSATEGVELLEVDVVDAGLLLELARRGFVDGLVEPHEPAGQRPGVLERRQLALDQEHLEVGLVEAEHHAVDGERRARILVRVGHGRSALPGRDVAAQLGELAVEAAGQDREPAPRPRVDVAIVEVKARREPLALPLVAAPQPEEPLDPGRELERGPLGVARQELLQHLDRGVLVADRRVLDGLEQVVGHQVGLVGLARRRPGRAAAARRSAAAR